MAYYFGFMEKISIELYYRLIDRHCRPYKRRVERIWGHDYDLIDEPAVMMNCDPSSIGATLTIRGRRCAPVSSAIRRRRCGGDRCK